jgi:hypothetical protein
MNVGTAVAYLSTVQVNSGDDSSELHRAYRKWPVRIPAETLDMLRRIFLDFLCPSGKIAEIIQILVGNFMQRDRYVPLHTDEWMDISW